MPRCTIVCAICGRMPLMMQSAPISCAAATVLSRCCATSVSTVGTPVISMTAMLEPVATSRSSRLSITTWVRSLSSVPISGSARMPSHSCTTGVDSSISSSCWRAMIDSRACWKTSVVYRPSASSTVVASHSVLASALGSVLQAFAHPLEQRLLQGKDERRHLRRGEPLRRPAARQLGEELADLCPLAAARVELDALLDVPGSTAPGSAATHRAAALPGCVRRARRRWSSGC